MDGMEANAVLRAARTWDARDRAVLIMKYADGLSNAEIAAALDLSEADAAAALRRVEALARQALPARGGKVGDAPPPTIRRLTA